MSPKIGENVGFYSGMFAGGLIGGYHTARFFHMIKAIHGGVYGMANAMTCVVVDQIARKVFKSQDYDNWPLWKKSLLVIPLSTIITGCVANFLGVQLLFTMSLKITAAAIVFGLLGRLIGQNRDSIRKQAQVEPPQTEGVPVNVKAATAPLPVQVDGQPGETHA